MATKTPQLVTIGDIAGQLEMTRDQVMYRIERLSLVEVMRAGGYRLFDAGQVKQIKNYTPHKRGNA